MVQLADADIQTREVLDWRGVHVLHFPMSSCSQKLRIFLNLKGVAWESREVNLTANENLTPWFLGINPRGLLPVLVHDGAVHIESNDILAYVDGAFPGPKLIPGGAEAETLALLEREDALHLDLRALSFRFVFAPPAPPKSPEDLARYAATGSGTVGGRKDPAIAEQIAFWQRYAAEGVTDRTVREAAGKFRAAFDELEGRLDGAPFLMGGEPTALDVAWFIYANRLALAGYPLARLHGRLGAWFDRLKERPEFAREIALPPPLEERFAATRAAHRAAGMALETVAGL